MIDTHAHLSSRFSEEIKIEGLTYVVLAASCLQDSEDNLKLSEINKKLMPAIGIHPQEINDDFATLEKLFDDRVVAIGECGLEFTDEVNETDKKKQIELFRKQIVMSQNVNRPLIVHSRQASDETLEILGEYKNLRGVIHCYSGGKKRIKKYFELPGEWYFGIDGNLTYEIGLEEVVKNIPKDRLILETDSPYLTPVPFRGEKNCPEYVKYVYQKVSEIWQMSIETTEKIIDDNAKRLFKLV
ncbi:MAG: TatD family hydrolase [Candidatus Shapirobacteria bacterium]|nr:TatD family hydrolase [Candidatus Shapirobacteria bacterium]